MIQTFIIRNIFPYFFHDNFLSFRKQKDLYKHKSLLSR
nr:MAG TPA: hypothetical protein [Caudoviricetes sp.]